MDDRIERLLAENEIGKQLVRFFTALDERRFETMTSIFAEDAVWRRAGVDIRGRQALLDAMDGRGSDRHTRHQLTNILVDMKDTSSAVAQFYSTAWVHVGPTDDKGVAPIGLPSSIGVYTATFKRVADGWLLSDMRSKPAFKKKA